MRIEEIGIKGSFLIKPDLFRDDRGYFFESFNQQEFAEKTGLDINFVQDNQSESSKGVLRGLHFQEGQWAQAKLVRVIKGRIYDVCVDLRPDSDTFGRHYGVYLDDIDHLQLFIPRGFAHGFLVMENNTIVNYKCDNYYNRASERGILYNDNDLNIGWPVEDQFVHLSEKDLKLPTLKDYVDAS